MTVKDIPLNLLERFQRFLEARSTGQVTFDVHEGRVKKIRLTESENAERAVIEEKKRRQK